MSIGRATWAFVAVLAASACPESAAKADEPPRSPETPRVQIKVGEGLRITAPDNSAELNIRARVQVQGVVETNAPDPKSGTRPAPDTDFLIRRMRLVFQGHVLRPSVRYFLQFGFAAREQEPDQLVPLRDAYVQWADLRDLNIRAGQQKVTFSHERTLSSASLQLVERSNVNAELSMDRDVGVQAMSQDLFGLRGLLRYYAGVFGGDGRNRVGGQFGLLWVGRIEVMPFGPFDDMVESDQTGSHKPRLAIGFAAAYNARSKRARSVFGDTFKYGTADYRHGVADFTFKLAGFSAIGGVVFRQADQVVVGRGLDASGQEVVETTRSAWGYFAQAGYFVRRPLEVAARYGEVQPLDGSGIRRDREVGGGLSYYFHSHDVKLQADYFRLLSEVAPGNTVSLDRVRIQTQVSF
jgi:hypothetical protein